MNAVVLNGFFVGLIYGLLGVGLVVLYRGSRVVNFAYGETGMLGAFAFIDMRFGYSQLGQGTLPHDRGLWLALPAAVAIAAALGALTERVVVRPLRNAPRIRPMVGTFAVGTLFVTFATRRWGLNYHVDKTLVNGVGVKLLGLQVQPEQILILIVSIAMLTGLWAMYKFTPFGLRLRALALDPYAAGLVGIDVNRTSLAVWALGGGLAGISAIMIAPLVGFDVTVITTLSIRGLTAALVGGLTNVGGTFAAGVLLGVAEAVITFKSPISGITDVAFAALVVVLLVIRPTGLVRSSY